MMIMVWITRHVGTVVGTKEMNIIIDETDKFSKDLYYIKEFDPDYDLGQRIQKILDRYLKHENKQGLVFIIKDKVRFRKGMGGYRGAVIMDNNIEAWWMDHSGFYFHDSDIDSAWNSIYDPEGRPWSEKYDQW